MSEVFDFIRRCGTFFVLTLRDNAPTGRPFGAIYERDGALYIATADTKPVYEQLCAHPAVSLLALLPGTRSWLRVRCDASECTDISIKRQMLEACPALQTHFPSPDAPHLAVFRLAVRDAEFNPPREIIAAPCAAKA